MTQPIEAKYVILNPAAPGDVPNGSVFIDSSAGNQISLKSSSGVVQTMETGGGTNFFLKTMIASGVIPNGSPVAKLVNGKIAVCDADDAPNFVGFAQEQANSDGHAIIILTVGANLAGVLNGLGFATGDEIFISNTGGYTNDPGTFDGNDNIIKAGIADCAAGVFSATATDLIAFPEVISQV